MRRAILLALALLASPAPTLAQTAAPYEAVLFESDRMIPMRDGVRMAVDIYRPARNGTPVTERLPVLLSRTPYDKTAGALPEHAKYFAEHGYVVVLGDTRGRYASEGVFSKYYDYDALDGFDTIEWISKLPYAEPKVGMWGTSYGAHTQADPSKLNPPALATLVLNMGGLSSGWDHKVRRGGAFELAQQLGWAFDELRDETDDPVVRALLEKETVHTWFAAMPLRKGLNPLSVAPNFEDYVLDMMTQADYGTYWKGLGVNWAEHYERTSDIPMIHLTGWYDPYVGSTLENYVGLSKVKRSPRWLVVGPWTHGGNARTASGDVEFGPEAAMKDWPREFHLRWFEHHLKGRSNGVDGMPRVRVFVMGTGDGSRDANGRLVHGGSWRDESSWPLPDTRFVRYYLHGDGSLSTAAPSGGSAATTFTYDPRNPVPTIGGSFSGVLPAGAYDQRERPDFYGSKPPWLPLKARPDVVVFQTEPLEEDVAVVGPVTVRLHVSSTAVDTDFTAKLVDVYPPSEHFPTGFDMNVTDGILRTRYRSSRERAEPMEPGRVYEVTVEPFPTANVFKKGHRIRIDISSSNFPRFDVNPNTGEPLGSHRRIVTADNTVHHGGEHASWVELPIVPARRR